MSAVLKLAAQTDTMRSAAHDLVREALQEVPDPSAIVVIAIGPDNYALRTVSHREAIKDFDLYARAGAILGREKSRLIE